MKIKFVAVDRVSRDDIERNKLASSKRDLPKVGDLPPVRKPLALVGGGPSVKDHAEELRNWPGDVWAINGAWKWCRDNGVKATFYTIDPSPVIADDIDGPTDAILGSACDPLAFDKVSGSIQVFPLGEIPSGSTSACTSIMIAALCGYTHVDLFGCDSSFTSTSTHVYAGCSPGETRLLVECGGEKYLTCPQMIMQAEYLAEVVNGVPDYVTIRSGGLLPALVKHGEWDALKASRNLMDALNANKHI
jgi:hypothetical protein